MSINCFLHDGYFWVCMPDICDSDKPWAPQNTGSLPEERAGWLRSGNRRVMESSRKVLMGQLGSEEETLKDGPGWPPFQAEQNSVRSYHRPLPAVRVPMTLGPRTERE